MLFSLYYRSRDYSSILSADATVAEGLNNAVAVAFAILPGWQRHATTGKTVPVCLFAGFKTGAERTPEASRCALTHDAIKMSAE